MTNRLPVVLLNNRQQHKNNWSTCLRPVDSNLFGKVTRSTDPAMVSHLVSNLVRNSKTQTLQTPSHDLDLLRPHLTSFQRTMTFVNVNLKLNGEVIQVFKIIKRLELCEDCNRFGEVKGAVEGGVVTDLWEFTVETSQIFFK